MFRILSTPLINGVVVRQSSTVRQISADFKMNLTLVPKGTESSMYIAFIESEFHLTAPEVTNKRFLFDVV